MTRHCFHVPPRSRMLIVDMTVTTIVNFTSPAARSPAESGPENRNASALNALWMITSKMTIRFVFADKSYAISINGATARIMAFHATEAMTGINAAAVAKWMYKRPEASPLGHSAWLVAHGNKNKCSRILSSILHLHYL